MRRRLTSALALLTVVGPLATGCLADLPLVQVVLDTRPLAVRVEVDGEPERAWPRPGEQLHVTWLVVDPTETVPVGWGFIACAGIVTPTGTTFCGAEPFDFQIQPTPSLEDPAVTFTLPDAATLEGVDIIYMAGVLCPSGTPSLDAMSMGVTCEGASEPEQVVELYVRIAKDGVTPNMNPTIPTDALTFDGAAWPAPTTPPAMDGCAAVAGTPELPLRSIADEDPVLGITGNLADREMYMSGDNARVEDLVFATYATHGEPSRFLSVIDDMASTSELDWRLPELADGLVAEGTLVRFWMVEIDQRQGTDWTARYACLVP